MKNLNQSKTRKNYETLYNLIKNYMIRNRVTRIEYQCAVDIATGSNINPMLLYSLVEGNLLQKSKRGLFEITQNKDIDKAYKLFLDITNNRQKSRRIKSQSKEPLNKKQIHQDLFQTQILEVNNYITEDICITFLKNKGYKILKPIQEYKEI